MSLGLVECLVLRGNVGEKEGITISCLGFGGRAPNQIGTARDVSAVQFIVAVNIISDLKLLIDAGIEIKLQPLPSIALQLRAIDVPDDEIRHAMGFAEAKTVMSVGNQGRPTNLDYVGLLIRAESRR